MVLYMTTQWVTLKVGDKVRRNTGINGYVANHYPERDIMRVVWSDTGLVEYYPRVNSTSKYRVI